MNKIIPFNKEIKFNGNIGEITSIALDDTLKFKDSYTIDGELIVRGCHKYNDIEEEFSFPIPTGITVDNKYDTTKAKIAVDDFYYEIINDDTLKVKIDLILDDLFFKKEEIKPFIEEVEIDKDQLREESDSDSKEKEILNEKLTEEVNDNDKDDTENKEEKEYSIYRVYIITNDDTLEQILDKYHVTKEELSYYNDLDNFKPGVKLIIPSTNE